MNNIIDENESLTRREREKAQHHQEILDAAVKVFAEKGFHAATLDEIAQEAEFSKAALYLYFSNKEDLLYNILNEAFEKLFGLGRKILLKNISSKDRLSELLNCIAEEIFKNPDLFSLLSAQHATLFKEISEEKRDEFIKKHDYALIEIKEKVIEAIKSGELRDIPPRAITGMLHGSIDAMVNNKWFCTTLEELNNSIPVFLDILYNGIAKKKENF